MPASSRLSRQPRARVWLLCLALGAAACSLIFPVGELPPVDAPRPDGSRDEGPPVPDQAPKGDLALDKQVSREDQVPFDLHPGKDQVLPTPDAPSCAGCLNPQTGKCQTQQEPTMHYFCGIGAKPCVNCVAKTLYCDTWGQCQTPLCGTALCDGCCSSSTSCLGTNELSDGQCGHYGQPCVNCKQQGQVCCPSMGYCISPSDFCPPL